MKQLRKSTGVFLYVTKQTKTTTSAPIDTPVDTTVDPHEFDCGLKVHNSCIKPKVFQSMKKKKIQNLILQWKILRLLTEKE